MAVRPRIIVALPNARESATIAEWLGTSQFEPVQRGDPRHAAREMHARDFDLLVTGTRVVCKRLVDCRLNWIC